MKRTIFAALLMATTLSPSGVASAQGNISMLGFGYPLAGLSIRSSGTAGALAEFDLLTPRNPSVLTGVNRMALGFQAEPEYKTFTYGSITEKTTIQRIPLIMAAVRVTSRAVFSLSSAGFLDRNFTTQSDGEAVMGNQVVATRNIADVRGSISDIRAGVGYRVNSRISVGLGGHVFTGTHKFSLIQQPASGSGLDTINFTTGVQYFGKALSVGGTVILPKGFTTALSYRAGGNLEADNGDSVLSRAKVPDRLSAGVTYRLPGALFSANFDQNKWTNMRGLGSDLFDTHDATNWSVGAEFSTGKIRGTPVLLRAGSGKNTLPFGINGGKVDEMRFAGGAAFAITNPGRDQAVLDFSIQRANRKMSGSTAKEGAWLLGIGIQIRP